MKFNININIELTWSKIMALVLLLEAGFIDLKTIHTGTIFMFAVPFVVLLITGKQGIDGIKSVKEITAKK